MAGTWLGRWMPAGLGLLALVGWIVLAGAAAAGKCGYDYCWGAVATGPNGASGYSFSHVSERNAHDVARSTCGEGKCTQVRTFYNACGAIAMGASDAWGWASGPTREAAQDQALAHCSRNGRGCAVRVWACSP